MNTIPIFPLNIYTMQIEVDWNRDLVINRLNQYFDQQRKDNIIVRTLHKEAIFKPIVDFMIQAVSEYWEMLDYDMQYPFEMSNLWANLITKEDKFPYTLENHSPAIISAVFYIQKENSDMGNLYFANPLEAMLQTQPLSQERRYKNIYQEYNGKTGEVVCFPSWLPHGVNPNKTDIDRISVAADFELKGLRYYKSILSKK